MTLLGDDTLNDGDYERSDEQRVADQEWSEQVEWWELDDRDRLEAHE